MRKARRKSSKICEKCSPEGPRRVQNERLEPSGALLGAMWAQGGRQERSKSPKKIIGWAPGPLRCEKLIGFRLRGSSPEAPGGLRNGIFGGLFGHAAWGTKKPRNLKFFIVRDARFVDLPSVPFWRGD